MDLKQLQRLHHEVVKHVSSTTAAGGRLEDHRVHDVVDASNGPRTEFQREIRQLRVALIASGKNPIFATRFARQVDVLIHAELQVERLMGKPHPPGQEFEDRVLLRTQARQKLNDLFEAIHADRVPMAKAKKSKP